VKQYDRVSAPRLSDEQLAVIDRDHRLGAWDTLQHFHIMPPMHLSDEIISGDESICQPSLMKSPGSGGDSPASSDESIRYDGDTKSGCERGIGGWS
jgi:hypothetical protein